VVPQRKRQLLAALVGALVSSPCVLLAGIGYSNVTSQFIVFLAVSPFVIAILSATRFDIAVRRAKQTRFGLTVAGCIGATLTCLTFVALYSLLLVMTRGGPWLAGFTLYAVFSIAMFWPVLLIGGGLVGWIAGTKRFAF
jgi:hypothetical protein